MTDKHLWSGDVELCAGRLVFHGRLGDAHRHRHAAVQVMVTAHGRMRLTDASGVQRSSQAVIIPPGAEHEMAGNSVGTMMFIDPAARGARVLLGMVRQTGMADTSCVAWDAAARPLLALAARPDGASQSRADAFLDVILEDAKANPGDVHPSLKRATEVLPSMLNGPVRLDELAAEVGISGSRLGHLFSDEFGLPFRAFVRWARLGAAMERARTGGTLTDAAHAAGFSDSAHLTRVCHEMFGLRPSDLAGAVTWR